MTSKTRATKATIGMLERDSGSHVLESVAVAKDVGVVTARALESHRLDHHAD